MRTEIIFFGRKTAVECDEKCDKAWGRNSRPRDDDENEIPDELLGTAPNFPGTWEGSDTKPQSLSEAHNKWCVRECERCSMMAFADSKPA